MPVRLEPPLLELGFYWRDTKESEAYRAMVNWFSAKGFTISRNADLVRAPNGDLPQFTSTELIGCEVSSALLSTSYEWTLDRCLTDPEWLALEIELLPPASGDHSVVLSYGPLVSSAPPIMGHGEVSADRHAIQVTASAADDISDRTIARRGEEQPHSNYFHFLFKTICSELRPTYAMKALERSLLPPRGFRQSIKEELTQTVFVDERIGLKLHTVSARGVTCEMLLEGVLIDRGDAVLGEWRRLCDTIAYQVESSLGVK